MRSNKKGFTLIELLAVIVILAIIALIATPIVLNIITKARNSAAADSVYGAMEAVKLAYTESLLDPSPKTLPLTVICASGACDNDVTMSGTVPEGTFTLQDTDGKFASSTVTVNGISCTIAATTNTVTCGS